VYFSEGQAFSQDGFAFVKFAKLGQSLLRFFATDIQTFFTVKCRRTRNDKRKWYKRGADFPKKYPFCIIKRRFNTSRRNWEKL